MPTSIERDIGRMESKIEAAAENIQEIRTSQAEMRREISEIHTALAGQKAVREWNWKVIGSISAISIIVTQIVNYLKVFLVHTS